MLIQLFFLGFASSSWEKSLLSDSATTTHHEFQDQNLDFAQAKEMLGFIKTQQIQSSDDSDNSRSSGPHTTPYRITPDNEAVTPEKIRLAVEALEEGLETEKREQKTPRLSVLQALAAEIVSYDVRKDLGEITKEKLRILSEKPLLKDLVLKQRGALPQSTVENCKLNLQQKGIQNSLNSSIEEVRKAACTRLEDIIIPYGTEKVPEKWAELVAHPIYQAYLQKKYPPHAASTQSKIARRGQEETAAASYTDKEPSRKKQPKETVISIPAIEGPGLSREDEIRQEWVEATKDLKLNKKDLDDDDLEVSQGRINADYQCRLGELFENLEQAEDAKREYQKAVLELWNIEVRHPDIQWKKHPATLKKNKTFLSIYKKTVEKCREKQEQYFVPPYYTFSGACDGLIEARYRMDLEDYDETARYLQFFEDRKPDWHKIDSSKYSKKCKKGGIKGSSCDLSKHQAYYNEILKELRENQGLQKAYEALKAQNRLDFWTLGVGALAGMAVFSAGFIFLMNYFLPKDPAATNTNDLTNPFGGIIGNVTESFLPDSNFSNFLQDVIANATFIPSAQPQNVNYSDNASTTMAPFAFSSTLAPVVQTCTDLAKCMLDNATFVAFLNQYLLDPSCGSTPAQWLHNLTCALIGKFYQYTQAVNMMCVLVKLQEANWAGVCAPTLPEAPGSIPDGSMCLEPGPIPPIRYSSVNLEIHQPRGTRFSNGFCVTRRQANPFVRTDTRELTESDELTDTFFEELSPDKSASFSDTAASGTRDESASFSDTLQPPPKVTGTNELSQTDKGTPTDRLSASHPLSASHTNSLRPRTVSKSLSGTGSDVIYPVGNCSWLYDYLQLPQVTGPWVATLRGLPCPGPMANDSIIADPLTGTSICPNAPAALKLFLNGLNIGPLGARVLSPALQQLLQLQCLVFYSNAFGDSGIIDLAKAFRWLSHVQYLHLSQNGLGDAGVIFLAKYLPYMKNLRSLLLHANNIGDAGAIALASAFQEMNNLTGQIIFTNNRIGDAGAIALARALQDRPVIRQLDISNNNITASTRAILEAMLGNVTQLGL